MILYNIIDGNGVIVGHGNAAQESDIAVPEGCLYFVHDETLMGHYLTLNGVPTLLPDRPSRFHTFDRATGTWVDLRDQAQREEDLSQQLSSQREAASLSKADFLLRCVTVGLLSRSSAMQAARGEIPDDFAEAIVGWPEERRFEIEVRWAALAQVDRNHPLILSLATEMGIPNAALDAIFGISPIN